MTTTNTPTTLIATLREPQIAKMAVFDWLATMLLALCVSKALPTASLLDRHSSVDRDCCHSGAIVQSMDLQVEKAECDRPR